MEINEYLLFITIAFAYIISPGPAVFLAINYGTLYGLKKTTIMLIGNATGIAVIAIISALGIGVFILSSEFLMSVIKILGFIVLFYIGSKMIIKSLKRKKSQKNTSTNLDLNKKYRDFYKEGLLMALSNPKPIIFFVAIYPQFINKESENFLNLFILGISFVLISYLCLNIYALLGKTILSRLLKDNGLRNFNLLSGITFIIMSVMMLLTKIN